MYLTHTHLR